MQYITRLESRLPIARRQLRFPSAAEPETQALQPTVRSPYHAGTQSLLERERRKVQQILARGDELARSLRFLLALFCSAAIIIFEDAGSLFSGLGVYATV